MPAPKNSAPRATPVSPLDESETLELVRRGEMGLEQYLEERVKKAVAPFVGKLSSDRFAILEANLRHLIRTDPVLVEMVRELTGQTPSDMAAGKN